MRSFIITRALLVVPTILGVVTLVFFFVHMVPGDPVVLMLGDYATPQEIQSMRHRLDLDRPLASQYGLYLDDLAHFDLGTSIYYNRPAAGIVIERFKYTFVLAVFAMLLSLLLSAPLGIVSAYRQGSWLDRVIEDTSVVGLSLPNFLIGIVLILIFSVKLNVLPVAGAQSASSIVLPGLTLAIGMSTITIRMVRANMIAAIRHESFTAGLARGLGVNRALFVHALKATLIPVVTLIGTQFGLLLSGAIVTETVFSWPGIGKLLVDSVATRDYPLLSAAVLVIASVYVFVNLATDIVYYMVEPRMRKRQ
ncbi:MAG: ABC transporter permease [Deltaproteobacteria bacterium]|nr:ABC transporter permease [Deltaproteobacteria bacterium]MCL5276576.1 ABC transporter permease [Deltaproteobacteria bacterium]